MNKIYDIIVIGGGPAGLTAALYGLRNGKSVLTIERSVFGGSIVNSPKVENIPGFASISGDEYGDILLNQVQGQGGEFAFDEVQKLEKEGDLIKVFLDIDEPVFGKTAILATGTVHRSFNFENEEAFLGKNIHFCAVCDGAFYADKKVVMIGGGNSAFVEAQLLSDIVKELVILQDLPYFTAEKRMQDTVLSKKNVFSKTGVKITGYESENGIFKGVRYEENGIEKTEECDGLFLAIGLIPDNERFKEFADLDQRGYFISGENAKTKNENIFVAGDCRTKDLRQVATAQSDGANAAIAACNYLNLHR